MPLDRHRSVHIYALVCITTLSMVWLGETKTLDTQGSSCLCFKDRQAGSHRSSTFACIVPKLAPSLSLSSVFLHRDPGLHSRFHSSEELSMFVVVQVAHGQSVCLLICVEMTLFYSHLNMLFLLLINSFIGMQVTLCIHTENYTVQSFLIDSWSCAIIGPINCLKLSLRKACP